MRVNFDKAKLLPERTERSQPSIREQRKLTVKERLAALKLRQADDSTHSPADSAADDFDDEPRAGDYFDDEIPDDETLANYDGDDSAGDSGCTLCRRRGRIHFTYDSKDHS